MREKDKFNAFATEAGKKAKNLLNKAIQAADQTDDGKFDLADVAFIVGKAESAVKKGAQELKERTDKKSRQMELIKKGFIL